MEQFMPPQPTAQRNELYAALAKAKLEYVNVRFNRTNTFNKQVYADLDQINKATEKALSKHGLVFIQEPEDIDGTTFLFSVLGHSSGQEIRCKNRLIIPVYTGAKSELSRFGEALAYLKRQVAQCMLGVTANNDEEDNDDAYASEQLYNKEIDRSIAGDIRPAAVDKGVLSERISAHELEDLHRELENYPLLAENILKAQEINRLSDMPKAKFREVIDGIRHRKIMLRDKPKKEW